MPIPRHAGTGCRSCPPIRRQPIFTTPCPQRVPNEEPPNPQSPTNWKCQFHGTPGQVAVAAPRSGGSQSCHAEPFAVSFGAPEVVLKLLVEPAFGAGVEGDREADRHLWADPGAP